MSYGYRNGWAMGYPDGVADEPMSSIDADIIDADA